MQDVLGQSEEELAAELGSFVVSGLVITAVGAITFLGSIIAFIASSKVWPCRPSILALSG